VAQTKVTAIRNCSEISFISVQTARVCARVLETLPAWFWLLFVRGFAQCVSVFPAA